MNSGRTAGGAVPGDTPVQPGPLPFLPDVPGGSVACTRERRARMPKLVHFEIPVDDAQRAGALYRDVLGWEASRFGGEPYWLVRAGAEVPSSSPAPASSRSSWRCC